VSIVGEVVDWGAVADTARLDRADALGLLGELAHEVLHAALLLEDLAVGTASLLSLHGVQEQLVAI